MLKDFIYTIEYDSDGYYDHCEYRIIDDNFEAITIDTRLGASVIAIYEERNLPVVPNLVRAYTIYSNRSLMSMDQIIKNQSSTNEKFKMYQDDVERLLLLL